MGKGPVCARRRPGKAGRSGGDPGRGRAARGARGFLELRHPWGFSPEARRGSQGASRVELLILFRAPANILPPGTYTMSDPQSWNPTQHDI